MRRIDKLVWVALLVFACLGTPLAAQTPSFQILVTPASFGTNVEAVGVSADGSVIIGKYFLSGTDPNCNVFGGCTRTFRWTAATGVQDLGLLDAHEALAHDLSADGSLIVGEASASSAFRRAFIWTPSTGMQDLGTPLFVNDTDHSRSEAFGMSATGSAIVGRAIPTQTSLIPQSFRFSTATGFSFLTPTLPNNLQSQANGVSDDSAVIVGTSYDSTTFLGHAFRWQAGVIQDLGNLGSLPAAAAAASADGSVVVGQSGIAGCTSGCTHAFRWTAAGGMQDLGDLDGGGSGAADVSADGSVVVGSAPAGPPGGLTRAFRWTPTNGMEDLNTVLANLGVNTGGWQLVFADAVSADGTVIVGMAENLTTNVDAAYRAVVPPPAGTCAPITCASLGKNCGTIPDGCGGTLNCGSCTAPQTCGGGGVANVCGPCTPTSTCAAQGKNCGAIFDGCGWIACGTCTAPQICGGTGTPNVCGTPPPIPKSVTLNPSTVVGGNPSTGTVTLSLSAPQGGALVTLSSSNSIASVAPNATVPAGQTSATFTITTNPPPQNTASSISACFNGQCAANFLFITAPTTCTPTTCAAQGKNCGTISDGCGGTLNCGTCTAPQTCGGGGVANVCGGGAATLTLTATGRNGETVFSTPAGLSVSVGGTGSANFTVGTSITLQVTNDRDVIWSGVCSSGGAKTKTCTFTLNANSSETANVQ